MITCLYSLVLTVGGDKMAQTDPHGWTLTLISVAVVFSALVILFGVYTLFGKVFAEKEIKPSTTKAVAGDTDVEAAIAAAVSLYLSESVHDHESGVLTIERRPSAWADKTLNFRKLPR